jgi:hypothetical protein
MEETSCVNMFESRNSILINTRSVFKIGSSNPHIPIADVEHAVNLHWTHDTYVCNSK